jgi:DNA polymerase III delta subunit
MGDRSRSGRSAVTTTQHRVRRPRAAAAANTIEAMQSPSSRPAAASGGAPLAYFWGDDAYGLEAAIEALRNDAARFPGGPPDRWRPEAERTEPGRLLGEIHERLATGSMFGDGSLVILRGVGGLIRSNDQRDALLDAIASLAPGNGLAIVEETESGAKDPPSKSLAEAIRTAGGEVRRFEAPRQEALAAWIDQRARERRITLASGAARELATRVGGFVREGDVERQQQGRIAVMELEKLALRHADDAPVTVEDVQALVPEAVPGSMWAFVDAVGMRQRVRALELLERLIEDRPAPVLLAVLHRRIRELIEVQDRLERGESPGSLVRSMRLVPFRAETLARQARGWTGSELDAALDGLVELDAQVKGVGGRASTDARDRLAFDLWITDRVAPA